MIKRLLPQTLLGRSLMIIVMPLVLLQIIAIYIFYERHWDTITRRLARDLAGEITVIIHLMERYPAADEKKIEEMRQGGLCALVSCSKWQHGGYGR